MGRLDHGKNHKLIIDADLWIIGDGELRNEIQEYIKIQKLENKIYLLGKKQNPFSFLSKADGFVFASNHEGFGLWITYHKYRLSKWTKRNISSK